MTIIKYQTFIHLSQSLTVSKQNSQN